MRAIEELMSDLEKEQSAEWIPDHVLAHLPVECVDEYMAALPEDIREIAIGYAQDNLAPGTSPVQLTPHTHEELARAAAFCDWVRRQGRFHHPRRPDEPDLAPILQRYDRPQPPKTIADRVRVKPWWLLRYLTPANVDRKMAELPDDVRAIVIAWAVEQYTDVSKLPTPRPWYSPADSELLMIGWLRRNGHLP